MRYCNRCESNWCIYEHIVGPIEDWKFKRKNKPEYLPGETVLIKDIDKYKWISERSKNQQVVKILRSQVSNSMPRHYEYHAKIEYAEHYYGNPGVFGIYEFSPDQLEKAPKQRII